MLTFDSVKRWRGRPLLDRDELEIGTIADIYLDEVLGEPSWALVDTGPGGRLALVPLNEAREAGARVSVPYGKRMVLGAPSMEVGGRLWPLQQQQLYGYYGLHRRWPNDELDGGSGGPPALVVRLPQVRR